MKMIDMQSKYLGGEISKKLYWTLMRENYTHVLPEICEILNNNEDCKSISIDKTGVILEKYDGVKLYFDFSESISRAEIDLLNKEDPERDEISFLSRLLKKYNCKTVFDIGANVGMFSIELYKNGINADYYLFEPIPTTYIKLGRSLKLNNITDKFNTYNIGMSNEKGEFDFYLPGESEAASLRPIEDEFYRKQSDEFGKYTGSNEVDKVKCKVLTVDEFVERNRISELDFIKIDVEGNEKFVLEGAKKTIEKYSPIIYSELLRIHAKRFGYHPNEVIENLKLFGYKCYVVENDHLRGIDKITEQTEETNFIFMTN